MYSLAWQQWGREVRDYCYCEDIRKISSVQDTYIENRREIVSLEKGAALTAVQYRAAICLKRAHCRCTRKKASIIRISFLNDLRNSLLILTNVQFISFSMKKMQRTFKIFKETPAA